MICMTPLVAGMSPRITLAWLILAVPFDLKSTVERTKSGGGGGGGETFDNSSVLST